MRLLFAALLASVTMSASAVTWIEIPAQPSDYVTVRYDKDSVSQTGPDQITVTWSEKSGGGSTFFIWTGIVDCTALSIVVTKGVLVGLMPPGKEISEDVDTLDPILRLRFSTPLRPEGRMLHALCEQINVTRDAFIDGLASAMSADPHCKLPDPTGPLIWCRNEPTVKQAIGFSLFRQIQFSKPQVSEACKISSTDLDRLFTDVLLDYVSWGPSKCAQDLACRVNRLDQFSAELGWDMASASYGKSCENIPRRLAILNDQQKRNEALMKFWACVDATIAKLDDRISSADVIASGVIGACQSVVTIPEFKSFMDDPANLEHSVKPTVIAKVLAQRVKNRTPEAKQKQKSQPQPTM
jgi:hypothetical protein